MAATSGNEARGQLTLQQVAELTKGQLQGDPAAAAVAIDGVGPIESAGATQLAALDDKRFLAAAKASTAAALFCPPKLAGELAGRTLIVTPVPQIAQNAVIDRLGLWPLPWTEPGLHATAQVAPTAVLGAGVSVGPYAVVGPRARIGAGTRLEPHAVVEPDAVVGARCRILSGAVICSCATLGDDCVVGHGAVVGGEGFGLASGRPARSACATSAASSSGTASTSATTSPSIAPASARRASATMRSSTARSTWATTWSSARAPSAPDSPASPARARSARTASWAARAASPTT